MIAGDNPISMYISGVPYFEANSHRGFLTPFLLPFSRAALIEPELIINRKYIEELPIAFGDRHVELVDEQFVSHLCPEFITTFKVR